MENKTKQMSRRSDLRRIFNAGLDAVRPDEALCRHLCLDGDMLKAGGRQWDLSRIDRIFVVGAGKGAGPMASALEDLLGERITRGLVCVKYDHTVPTRKIRLLEAAHPVPDEAGVAAARQMLGLVEEAGERDLVICLITGGASALTPATAEGISLDQVREMTQLLLGWGAEIHEINALRKHVSCFGGGYLAAAAMPAQVISLIISDVIGDDLDVIASGPTTPDRSTYGDCMDILERYNGTDAVPPALVQRLKNGRAGNIPETPKPDHPAFDRVCNVLAATNVQALDAAAKSAETLGYSPLILMADMRGEARIQAGELVEYARNVLNDSERQGPVCLLAGGETTVTLTGKGKGGRNQEMALAASLHLDPAEDIAMLCAGTDGTDGPTDAAGGFACPLTLAALGNTGISAQAHLDDNNAYAFLEATDSLLKTGPTLTNVMDLVVILIGDPREA
ncbi:MAG: glycerate kinase [Desulfobacterales bacterium]|nr:glycerate kinase [Desulfobacterales bacterium]